ncbi:DUF3187 family protein [Alkalimarinus alittae]|uniref:DUF3187 family protein n=1 Tax=Alkalimarinus alittae TaxID=2961619 RepID=A0ABY6MZC8_9ALTE|nr:DUF3187 family protein [Alkalimarinus alittae]UZE95180.1 DUF3187 family protein [Alkalimarinus alittae]
MIIHTINRRVHIKTAFILLIICASLLPFTAQSVESHAFNTLNLNPMVQIFGLPSLANQVLGAQGLFEVEIEQQTANYYSQSISNDEVITLDGETWKTRLNIAYALTDHSEISISVPYIRHSSGYMDDLIYNWHDTFGMPQNNRTKSTNNNIDLYYSVNGKTPVDLNSTVSGIGDIRLTYAHQLNAFNRDLILQTVIKLPTGDVATLTGSGGTDLSIGLMINDAISFERQNINTWAGAAVTYLGKADGDLSDNQKDLAWSASAGLGWPINSALILKTQFDGHSAVYNSNTTELGDPALMLTFGGDYYFTPLYRLELSAVEDIIAETSPDIVFSVKFSAKFE